MAFRMLTSDSDARAAGTFHADGYFNDFYILCRNERAHLMLNSEFPMMKNHFKIYERKRDFPFLENMLSYSNGFTCEECLIFLCFGMDCI